jgi:molybdenum cofactor cytidylyltransferase
MTGLIILAAGESTRLGEPKQNLLFQNKTLLQRAIESGLNSKCRPVIVVLGANADMIIPSLQNKAIEVIYNPGWKEGMASAIRMGISEIGNDNTIKNAVITLCDQPFVSSELIDSLLLKQQETNKAIVACSYQDTIGVPVLFDRSLFAELLLLKGYEGAKHILKDHPQDIETIPFDMGSIDIDTIEDYKRLINFGRSLL